MVDESHCGESRTNDFNNSSSSIFGNDLWHGSSPSAECMTPGKTEKLDNSISRLTSEGPDSSMNSLLGLPTWDEIRRNLRLEHDSDYDGNIATFPANPIQCTGRDRATTEYPILQDHQSYSLLEDALPSRSSYFSGYERAGHIPSRFTGQPLDNGYDLRLAPRLAHKQLYGSLTDQDYTGDYHPDCNKDPGFGPALESCRKRERPNHLMRHHDHRPKAARVSTWQQGRHQGDRLVVKLHFSSARGNAELRGWGSSLDNWPDENDCNSSSEPAPMLEDPWHTYNFRPRKDRGLAEISHREGDGLPAIEDVTLGNPAARGCKGCFLLQQRCPLLDHGSTYPCNICIEDGVDCELITEPRKKGPCLNCVRRRLICSYRAENSDHSSPCEQCLLKQLRCIAGPASGHTRTGPCLDAKFTATRQEYGIKGYVKRFSACTNCRQMKMRCSHSASGTAQFGRPCTRCRKKDVQCTFEPIKKTVGEVQKQIQTMLSRQSAKGSDDAKQAEYRVNVVQTIRTKITYPLYFGYSGDKPCQWCQDPFYGLLGLGEVEVEVIDPDGQGYVELGGGHADEGHPPSRMCDDCTLERLMIAACHKHEVIQLEGTDPNTFDYDAAMDFLVPGRAASAPFLWCSICPAPAFFACSSQRMAFDVGEDEVAVQGQDSIRGCGLLLCQSCATRLSSEKSGDLGTLVRSLRLEEGDDGGFGLRADVDFLLPQGELLRRMGAEDDMTMSIFI